VGMDGDVFGDLRHNLQVEVEAVASGFDGVGGVDKPDIRLFHEAKHIIDADILHEGLNQVVHGVQFFQEGLGIRFDQR